VNPKYLALIEATQKLIDHPRSEKARENAQRLISQKFCPSCGEYKDKKREFTPNKQAFDGYCNTCKSCRAEQSRQPRD